MLARYELQVSFKGAYVFKGAFTSINRAIKMASCFDSECRLYLYDFLNDRSFPDNMVYELVKEFQYDKVLS